MTGGTLERKRRTKQITESTSQISTSVFIVSDGRKGAPGHSTNTKRGVRWTMEEEKQQNNVYEVQLYPKVWVTAVWFVLSPAVAPLADSSAKYSSSQLMQ